MKLKQIFFLGLYYGIGYHLPSKNFKLGGGARVNLDIGAASTFSRR